MKTTGVEGVQPVLREAAGRSTSFRRALACAGPGYLVAVGYMDPGNWATDIAAGSAFGYALLSIVLLASLMAMLLQSLAARLAIATGTNLAQACRQAYPQWLSIPLWVLAEIAICACDLAELLGTALGLQLLFGIPLVTGVWLTAADILLLLALQRFGMRWLEALVISMLALIGACFAIEIIASQPSPSGILKGYAPDISMLMKPEMVYLAAGILGATVMPHNLYLHSALIRPAPPGVSGRQWLAWATWDSNIALSLAFLINSAILIVAASVFHAGGQHDVAGISEAHALLEPALGAAAATLFAVALLAAGQSSVLTATLAGQIVMEGFLGATPRLWTRRLATRALALLPAVIVLTLYGDQSLGELLIASQVILSMQLPFAVVPLVLLTSDGRRMGALKTPKWVAVPAWTASAAIILLNLKLVTDIVGRAVQA
jgi:manganese transport protein